MESSLGSGFFHHWNKQWYEPTSTCTSLTGQMMSFSLPVRQLLIALLDNLFRQLPRRSVIANGIWVGYTPYRNHLPQRMLHTYLKDCHKRIFKSHRKCLEYINKIQAFRKINEKHHHVNNVCIYMAHTKILTLNMERWTLSLITLSLIIALCFPH